MAKVKEYLGAKDIFLLRQTHSSIVVKVDGRQKTSAEGDGSITTEPNLAIGVYTADCVPLLLHDQDQTVVASLHCGWRGLAKGIIQNAASKLENLGKCNIKCIMGPSIQEQSYSVDKDHMNQMVSMDPQSAQFFRFFNNELVCDLRAYAKLLLENQKIQITRSYDLDTCTNPQLYPSYRRAQNEGHEEPRRMLSAIMLSAANPDAG